MPRRHESLVCQFLEGLSSEVLEEHADLVREFAQGQHGVYALYDGKRLYYVGLATNLRTRLHAHLKDRHRGLWSRFSMYLTINNRHMKELESLLLRIAKPDGNRHGGKFAKAENLKRRLHLAMRVKHKASMRSMLTWEDDDLPVSKRGIALKGKVSVRLPMKAARKLRTRYKGKNYSAMLRCDGTIRFKGEVYHTASKAAFAVVKRAVNGWTLWQIEQAPGKWVRLAKVRA